MLYRIKYFTCIAIVRVFHVVALRNQLDMAFAFSGLISFFLAEKKLFFLLLFPFKVACNCIICQLL